MHIRTPGLAVLLLLPWSGCLAIGDDPSLEVAGATAPDWRALALVVRNTDVSWTDATGAARRVVSTMSAGEEAAVRAEVENIPALFSAWSSGMGRIGVELRVVDDAIRSISPIGDDSYWVSQGDAAALLDAHAPPGSFDSVFLIFDPDDDGTIGLPIHAFWGLVGVDDSTNGATFASMLAHGDAPSTSATRGEAYVHEWLHGANAYYRNRGFDVPDPHDNLLHGYGDDGSGSWGAWYTALMSGRLRGGTAGITSDVWLSQTPRGATATPDPDPDPDPDPVPDPSPDPGPGSCSGGTGTPVIRAASMQDADWLYLEWDPVVGACDYTLFAVTGAGSQTSRVEAGAADRGPFLYTYFHRSEICATAPAGTHTLWVQIWPGADSTRAISADASGTVSCP